MAARGDTFFGGCCCVLFSKPAVPGRVKTRLIGELDPEQAARLHQAFLDDLLGELASGAFELRVAWALEAGEEPPSVLPEGFAQSGADLGERIFSALQRQVRAGFPFVAAVGSDHPELVAGRVEAAFRGLEEHDVVLGPAHDGGYYLIALRAAALSPRLFSGIDWSTPSVLRQTLVRCDELGLARRLLEPGADVDTPADLAALAQRLRAASGGCLRTRAVLAELGRL